MIAIGFIWLFLGFMLWLNTPRSWLALVICIITWPFFLVLGVIEIIKEFKGG